MRLLALLLSTVLLVNSTLHVSAAPGDVIKGTTYKERKNAARFLYYLAKPEDTHNPRYKTLRIGPAFCVLYRYNEQMSCVPDKPFEYTGE